MLSYKAAEKGASLDQSAQNEDLVTVGVTR